MSTIPLGLCQCGCGQPTTIAQQSSTRLGYVKGQPRRFVFGHNSRTKPLDPNTSFICACGCGRALRRAKYRSQQGQYIHGHNPSHHLDPANIARRFWAFVEKSDGCWLFRGCDKGPLGHARFHVNGRRRLAHRFSWELANGPIPPGLFVLHRCDNGACVRPDHLFLGTQRENVHDCIAKGRWRPDRGKRETHSAAGDERGGA